MTSPKAGFQYLPIRQPSSWGEWGRNVVYKASLTVLSPFTSRAGALITYSRLEEFLEPYRQIEMGAEETIYNLLLEKPEIRAAFQQLLDTAYEGDPAKIQGRVTSFEDAMRGVDGADLMVSVARDVQSIAVLKQKVNALPTNVVKMKQREEEICWRSLSRYPIPDLDPAAAAKWIDHPSLLRIKVMRRLINRSFQQRIDLHEVEKSLQQLDKEGLYSFLKRFLADDAAKELSEELLIEMSVREADIEAFCTALDQLRCHFQTADPADMRHANREAGNLFRMVLVSKVYTILKEDPDNSLIAALHRLAVATWCDVKVLSAYRWFGQSLLEATGGERVVEPVLTPEILIERLQSSHATAERQLYSDRGFNLIGYSLTHPKQIVQSLASQEGFYGRMANLGGEVPYDPRQVRNNSSILGDTRMCGGEINCRIRTCYGGTPTIARQISPEFLALLQAIENNHFAQKRNPDIPDRLLYVNLQNMNIKGEGPRSRSIMNLNTLFPKVFFGITLSKDSEFYQNADWKDAESFKERFREVLMNPSSFSLQNRYKDEIDPNDGGFYFPPNHNWEAIFDLILDIVAARFQKLENGKNLSGPFQEYFYSLLQVHLELHLGKQTPSVMALRACKEDIDRGAVEKLKSTYYYLPDSYFSGSQKEEGLSLIVGLFHSRALSARERMIHIHRTHEAFHLMRLVSREAFREDLQKLGVDSLQFTPILD